MAKNATALAKTDGGAVASSAPTGAMATRLSGMGAKGVSTAQEDNLVPLIYLLQDMSPQVKKKDPAYIEGAEAGDIWLRNAANPIVVGEEGFRFQPCYFTKDIVEWVPRKKGGGMVGRHDKMPANAVEAEVEGEDGNMVKRWVTPAGNELIETRYHIGFVLRPGEAPLPYTIPLKGTGHSFSKAWMFMMNSKLIEGNKVPSFACSYLIKSEFKSKGANSWHQFKIDDSDTEWMQTDADIDRGEALHDAFVRGEKKIDDEVVVEGAGDKASSEI